MNLPTDRLEKFITVLGLAMMTYSYGAWWPYYEEVDIKSAELLVRMEGLQDAYKGMAKGVNDQVAVINSVRGDGSKLDSVHWQYLEKREKETQPFADEANRIAKEMAIPMAQFEHQYKRFVIKSWLLGGLGAVGALFFVGGIYAWWKRQKRPADA